MKLTNEMRDWLIEVLTLWADTYDEDEEPKALNRILRNLLLTQKHKESASITPREAEELLFHVWQQAQGEEVSG